MQLQRQESNNNQKTKNDIKSHPPIMKTSSGTLLPPLTKRISSPRILSRNPSFLSTNRESFLRHTSLELLNPTHNSSLRKSSPFIAMLNLVATVCGGGVLSLPLAFARAGIIPASILMVLSALMTDFGIYILCSCARRTGGKSYSDVACAAFGRLAEVFTTTIISAFVCFVLIAYMVLAKDIWTPVLLRLFPQLLSMFASRHGNIQVPNEELTNEASNYVLVVLLLLVTPLLLKRDLHALRHTCFVGFSSLILLTIAVAFRAIQQVQLNALLPKEEQQSINWCTDKFSDILFAFPIIALSFFSSFNVLSVHGALVNPTRKRVKLVLDGSIGICFFFFYIVGLCGYLYARNDTLDNILLNFPLSDNAILLSRIGYGFTLLFGMPLVTLPCREAILSVPEHFQEWREERARAQKYLSMSKVGDERGGKGKHLIINGVDFDEERPLIGRENEKRVPSLLPKHSNMSENSYGSTTNLENSPFVGRVRYFRHMSSMSKKLTVDDAAANGVLDTHHEGDEEHQQHSNPTLSEYFVHISSTAAIVLVCFFTAVAVPGVATVWSICGSSMSIIIGFIVPAGCYLKIRSRKKINPRFVGAWTLLFFSTVTGCVCTTHVIMDMRNGVTE
uniref:Amino acid transporter transmembrane domain-containing protein n=2 Tax=Ditylum brightwellii TaxID=49249 RepID=A0A7S4VL45_9STRA|mmetsp:Transcript_34144/g.51519  ORF Transcript_34144/g.51519 Transcript_34144/m.51519 type:complete len:619 (+) Transcript_34144:44-1900(+)